MNRRNESIVMSRGELHASKWYRRMKEQLIKGEGRERNLASRGVTAIYINERGAPARPVRSAG